jgi:hypothetical protein
VWWPLEAGPQQGRDAGPAVDELPERNCSLLDLKKVFLQQQVYLNFFLLSNLYGMEGILLL